MGLLYIFAASTMEGEGVRKLAVPANSNAPFRCGANDVVLIISGMGPRSAKSKAEAVLQDASGVFPVGRPPDAVLIIGLCGGLTASLPEGRIVAYTECLSTEPATSLLRSSQTIADSLAALLGSSSSIPCDRVVGITSPRIATTRDQRLALAKLGAAVVDMESYWILAAAQLLVFPRLSCASYPTLSTGLCRISIALLKIPAVSMGARHSKSPWDRRYEPRD